MKKKRWIIFAVFMVMLLGMAAKTYATAKQITAKDLQSLDDPATKSKISEILVKDMEKNEVIDPNEVQSIAATYANVMGKEDDDAVIVIKYGPNISLVGAYKKAGGVYDFLGEIGVFFDVQEVNSINLKNLNKDVVFLKEYADQRIGAFERTTFLRGYLWNKDGFKLIYSTPEQISADWNKYWDIGEENGESQWNRIKQTSKTKLENGNYPIIKAERSQSYLKSNDTMAKNIPDDSTFSEVVKRDTCESYYWSDPWEQFILSEKLDKTTGEKVAIIEDWANLAYSIVPDFEAYGNKVRIVRMDGTTDIVAIETLSDVKKNRNTIDKT